MQTIIQIRESLRAARLALQQDYFVHRKSQQLLRSHARVVDDHLRLAWQMLSMPAEIALIEVGIQESEMSLLLFLLFGSKKHLAVEVLH